MSTVEPRDFDELGDPVIVLDKAGRITYCNRACTELIGRRLDDLRGSVVWELPLRDASTPIFHDLRAALNQIALQAQLWLPPVGQRERRSTRPKELILHAVRRMTQLIDQLERAPVGGRHAGPGPRTRRRPPTRSRPVRRG